MQIIDSGKKMLTLTVETESAPDAIFAFLTDVRRLPMWAPTFVDSVQSEEGGGWTGVRAGHSFALRAVTSEDSRTVDFLRQVAPGREGGAYIRVVDLPGGGSLVIMSVPILMREPEAVAATLAEELASLVALTSGQLRLKH